MIDMQTLIDEVIANEPKTIYDSFKATNSTKLEWDTLTFTHGGSAHAVVTDKTITLTYVDGTVETYTDQ